MRNLRVDQVAGETFLNCTPRTVYRLIAEGQLVAFRVRSSLRVTEASVQAYLKRQIAIFQEDNGMPDSKV